MTILAKVANIHAADATQSTRQPANSQMQNTPAGLEEIGFSRSCFSSGLDLVVVSASEAVVASMVVVVTMFIVVVGSVVVTAIVVLVSTGVV